MQFSSRIISWPPIVSGLLVCTVLLGSNLESVLAASSWKPTLLANTEAFQIIDDADTTADVRLQFGSLINKNLTYERSAGRFRFDDDLYVQGDTNVSGTLSGSAVFASVSLAGAGLTDCDTSATSKLLYDLTTKKFSCGTDQTGGGGGGVTLTRIAGSSGAAGADMTWQNLTANSADCTTTALCTIMTTTGVGAGTWKFKYTLIYQTAAATTGISFGMNHTGTAGQYQAQWTHPTTGGAAATGIGDNDTATAAGQLMEGKNEGVLNAVIGSATVGVAVANTDILAVLEGIIVVTASGDLQMKMGSEVAASAVRIMADSTLELVKIE